MPALSGDHHQEVAGKQLKETSETESNDAFVSRNGVLHPGCAPRNHPDVFVKSPKHKISPQHHTTLKCLPHAFHLSCSIHRFYVLASYWSWASDEGNLFIRLFLLKSAVESIWLAVPQMQSHQNPCLFGTSEWSICPMATLLPQSTKVFLHNCKSTATPIAAASLKSKTSEVYHPCSWSSPIWGVVFG